MFGKVLALMFTFGTKNAKTFTSNAVLLFWMGMLSLSVETNGANK